MKIKAVMPVIVFFGLTLVTASLVQIGGLRENLAAVFFIDSVSEQQLKSDYKAAQKKIKILIIPGHDSVNSGAQYKNLVEADLNLRLAISLRTKLSADRRFDVMLSRGISGYDPKLNYYFQTEREAVMEFMTKQKKDMKLLIDSKLIQAPQDMAHGFAPKDAAIKLYAMNKWMNENDFDLAVHIHFNDHPRKNINKPGVYKGFSIYAPHPILSNSKASLALARKVKEKLEKHYTVSNFSQEATGVVPDHELIALGANNTLDAASILVEYGYIYEAHLQNANDRDFHLMQMAEDTYQGIITFFD